MPASPCSPERPTVPESTPPAPQRPETFSREVALADGAPLAVRWAGFTDPGRKRENNQDDLLMRFPLFVVADGMGGHAGRRMRN